MRATISDLDGGVEVEIELSTAGQASSGVGAGTALALCPESDRLLVNEVEADEVYALGHLFYTAEFQSPAQLYEVELLRRDKPDVTVTVEPPPSFEIIEPAVGDAHSRRDPLEVSWAQAWTGHMSELSVTDEIGSSCIEGLGDKFDVDDTGSYLVGAGVLVGEASGNCEATVTLTRIIEAEYPSILAEGGSVTALVKRRRVFTSVE